jgi:hypothetical protein
VLSPSLAVRETGPSDARRPRLLDRARGRKGDTERRALKDAVHTLGRSFATHLLEDRHESAPYRTCSDTAT